MLLKLLVQYLTNLRKTILDDATSTNAIFTTGTNTRIYMTVRDCPWQSLRTEGNYIRTKVYGGSITYFTGTAGTSNLISFYGTEFNGARFRGAIKVTIQDCISTIMLITHPHLFTSGMGRVLTPTRLLSSELLQSLERP